MTQSANPQSPEPNTQFPIPTFTRPRWLYIFALLVMIVTTIPYLMGYASQGAAWRFTGFVFGVEDGNSYIAKMLGGAAGEWLFRTPYSAVPQRGVIAFLPYLLLGKLTAPPAQHIQLVALFHLFRFGAGILAILATYDFIALFVTRPSLRRWGVGLASLGGGLGWVLLLLGRTTWLGWLPLEFYSPESFGFLSLYGLPHLAMSRALLLWGLRAYLLHGSSLLYGSSWNRVPAGCPDETQRNAVPLRSNAVPLRSGAWLTGVYWLIMGFFQPLAVVVAWGVLGAHLLVLGLVAYSRSRGFHTPPVGPRWELWKSYFKGALVTGLVSSPIVVYTLVSFRLDPVLKSWTEQNLITSPPFPHYLLAYGVLLPFVVLGLWRIARSQKDWAWLPVAWVCALPFFVYAPYNLQRRLAEGTWVALVILALKALDGPSVYSGEYVGRNGISPDESLCVPWRPTLSILNSLKKRRWSWVFTLAFPSTIILLVGGMLAVRTPTEPIFRPAAEVAAFQYLAQNADPDAVVLSSRQTGNPLPAWAPLQVVVGHGPETIHAEELLPRVRAFYQADTPEEERLALLREYQVDYVFYGPAEQALGDWNPTHVDYLTPVYGDGEYIIFETQH
ncbi:MAG: hypothetical protein MAG431_02470 [Chloroflexi bacterium]|nr:hypothetical protein [Chloroflexota bacterium]